MKCKNVNCCCNCKYQIELMKHPQNKLIGKGSISERMGYVCTVTMDSDSIFKGYYFENKHGECEMYESK